MHEATRITDPQVAGKNTAAEGMSDVNPPDPVPGRPGLSGVYFILSTPFGLDGLIDFGSVRRLVEGVVNAGVAGITVLGVAGEAQKLTAVEREELTGAVIQAVEGRVPVIVGASYDGTDLAQSAARSAEVAGGSGLLIAPPTFAQPGSGLITHFQKIASTTDLPIVLQDYPLATGVILSPRAMADIVVATPNVVSVKLEGVPTPQRVGQTLELTPPGVTVVGGLGATYLLDELRHGASGTMTGFAYPEVLVSICSAWSSGRRLEAADLYYKYLPMLVLEGQTGIGLAIRKESLHRRGWIDCAITRQPGPVLDRLTRDDLEQTESALALASHHVAV
jgi:4-hydroxy-tetrahydrodipicolinate synthase